MAKEIWDKIENAVLEYEDTDPGYENWAVDKSRNWKEDIAQIVCNELLVPIYNLRVAQKNWFKTKDKKYLAESFRREAEVDKLLSELLEN